LSLSATTTAGARSLQGATFPRASYSLPLPNTPFPSADSVGRERLPLDRPARRRRLLGRISRPPGEVVRISLGTAGDRVGTRRSGARFRQNMEPQQDELSASGGCRSSSTHTGSFQKPVRTCTGTHNKNQNNKIKLRPTGAQTCAPPLFCDRDLEINPITLKLEGDLDTPNMYLHTENEAAS